MGDRLTNTPLGIQCLDTTANILTGNPLFPFAYEEVIARKVGAGSMPPVVHIWRHERAMIMGLRDGQMPEAKRARAWLEEQGYTTIIRHSGGAAVPLDCGVVNVSLILPKPVHQIDFRHDFQVMVQFLRQCLDHYTEEIRAGEIIGSYCPGDYDLSIGGQKFCGISQRRQLQAVIIQAFVVVEGKGAKRGRMAQEFYRIAGGDAHPPQGLHIKPEVMASLSELVGLHHASDFVELVKRTTNDWHQRVTYIDTYDSAWLQETLVMMDTLRQRYDQ